MQQHVIQQKDQALYIIQVRKNSKCERWFTLNSNSIDKNEGIMAAYQTGDYTIKQIADEFGLHYTTVSRIVKKAEKR
ncbi:helix-turn-helix domain-containing protein [Nitrosomonas sp. Nm132]|uniref:MarR family transcriptional regulator n=1 Tax=Nitrosomonas sp. Nm132 TaxID=1881053 RepID=UPI000887B472|nr:MarR family winged helix-turn-helix transcriptional regulator [Nitrosomonas sp. Nm132]SDG84004.1 Homeodomain-like domain-containing protein [Nitrosomonas sp. Nm132]